MGNYICNLIVPGFGKSGTSSLHHYLSTHPDICMSEPKEPHYFTRTVKWRKGADYHNALFNHCEHKYEYYGESSTTYCISRTAINRIKKCLLNPRIVFILRDPVNRLISHYKWLYALGLENRGIIEAISSSGYGFDPDQDTHGNYFSYVEFSSYSKYLPLWYETFGESSIYVMSSESLKDNPNDCMNSCFDFLSLKKTGIDTMKEVNVTSRIRPAVRRGYIGKLPLLLPDYIINQIKNNKMIKCAWDIISVPTIEVPIIKQEDVSSISMILKEDTEYYKYILSSNNKHTA